MPGSDKARRRAGDNEGRHIVKYVFKRVLEALGIRSSAGGSGYRADQGRARAEDSGRAASPLFGVLVPIDSDSKRRR